MQDLLTYLNGLAPDLQREFARRCGTTVGYLRKAVSAKERLRVELCIGIERESGGRVRGESLRPDVDWKYLEHRIPVPDFTRNTPPALSSKAPAAINSEAAEVAHG